MFCPNCGAADQMPSAYCRKCGEWLVDPKKVAIARIPEPPEQRVQLMSVFSAVNAILAAVSIIALFITHWRKATDWSEVLAVAALTTVTIHQTLSFLFGIGLVRRFNRNRKKPESLTDSGPVTNKLGIVTDDPHRLASPPLIVEDTTKVLETDRNKTPPLPKRG